MMPPRQCTILTHVGLFAVRLIELDFFQLPRSRHLSRISVLMHDTSECIGDKDRPFAILYIPPVFWSIHP